jgi:hypothetical protein
VNWDARTVGPWATELDGAAAIMNLVGRSVDCRKTAANRKVILESRVDSVRALAGRSPAAIHGGWTIASRHAGVVLGLVLLTPVFVGDLDRQRERATQKGAELVLDARIDALTKIDLAQRIASDIKRNPGRLPDINRSFAAVHASERERPQLRVLQGRLDDQLDRAATSSFERSFLFAAGLAGLALIPIALTRGVTL